LVVRHARLRKLGTLGPDDYDVIDSRNATSGASSGAGRSDDRV
jgi:hypothetical protein